MSTRSKTIVASIVLLLLAALLGMWWFKEDPQMQKVKELQKSLFTEKGPPSREKMDLFRQEMDKLTPEQRMQVMRPMGERMERRMEKRLDDYFAISDSQKTAYLDNELKEMEKRDKEMKNRPPPGNQPGPPPGGGRGGPGGPGGAPGSDQGKMGRNGMLDRMSPERRAKMDQFMNDMMKRRIEKGLPARPPRPSGPPPGPPPQ